MNDKNPQAMIRKLQSFDQENPLLKTELHYTGADQFVVTENSLQGHPVNQGGLCNNRGVPEKLRNPNRRQRQ
jgi:hypothetical protein